MWQGDIFIGWKENLAAHLSYSTCLPLRMTTRGLAEWTEVVGETERGQHGCWECFPYVCGLQSVTQTATASLCPCNLARILWSSRNIHIQLLLLAKPHQCFNPLLRSMRSEEKVTVVPSMPGAGGFHLKNWSRKPSCQKLKITWTRFNLLSFT